MDKSNELDINEQTRQRNEAAAIELWQYIANRDGLPLSATTIQSTIERYQGDDLGAAMAADITHTLVPELALDGSMDDIEIDVVDELVETLRKHGLSGIPIDAIAEVLNVNLNLGGLNGILEICEQLTNSDRKEKLDYLLGIFNHAAANESKEAEEEAIVYDYTDAQTYEPVYEELEDDDQENEDNSTRLSDKSGEEFEI